MHTPRTSISQAVLLAASITLAPLTFSQSAPPSPVQEKSEPPDTMAKEAPVELNPFEVRGDKDTGYAAQNTVMGSRFNTSLMDTPAAISVFTTQFIEDIGATNVDDLVEYSVNTRNNLLSGGNSELAGGDPIITIRGISTQGTGSARFTNFFPSSFSQDAYNMERAELTRGPNSVLYGVGLPAGGFNVTTKKADVRRQQYSASFRFGSYNQARGTVDLNQPLIKDKLAIRIDAVDEKHNDWHPFAFKDDKRWSLAARWQAARHMRLDAEYEHGNRKFSTAPQMGISDAITPWIAAGRKIDSQVGAPFPANAGLQLLANPTTLRYDMTTGAIYNLQNQSVSATAGATPGAVAATGEQQRMLSDFTLVPRNVFLGGPAYGNINSFNRTTLTFSHELFRNLSIEAAYNHETNDSLGLSQSPVNGPTLAIYADTNAFLPNGAPNPHVGQFYTESGNTRADNTSHSEDYRISAAYEYDFSERQGFRRWLGHHQFSALGEFREEDSLSGQQSEFLVQNPQSTSTPDAAANQLVHRTYFDLNGPIGQIGMADVRKLPMDGMINLSTGKQVSTAILPASQPRDTLLRTNTSLLVWQAHLLADRLVTTIGYRKDRLANWGAPTTVVRAPGFGPFAQGSPIRVRNVDPDYGSGITRTQGVVAHPVKWAAFFYNRSSSFSLPAKNVKFFPETFAGESVDPGRSVKGVTDDYGMKFPVWKGRVFATVTYYQTNAVDQARNGNLGTYKTDIPAIWTTLDSAGVLAANGLTLDNVTAPIALAQASAFDSQARGWEFELTANPTPNWRLLLNYSTNKTVQSNTALEIQNYYAANSLFWLQGDRARLVIKGTPGQMAASANDPNDGLTTIYKLLQTDLTALTAQFAAPDGARAVGVPVDAGNARTNYSFREGFLKGFSIGAGARWRGQRVLAYTTSDPATRQEIRSNAELTVDADLAYRKKLSIIGAKYDLTVRLNFTNLLDNDHLIYTATYTDGRLRSFSIPAPRAWFVTTTVRF